jgi:hypothetical protein
MGVRRRDTELRDSLDALLTRKQPEIQAILKQYGVPVFPVVEESAGDDDDDGPPSKPTG